MNKTNETIYRKRITRPIRIAFMMTLIMMFFVISPLVVLYAMGYRYDAAAKLITQSGVITVETEQRDVIVTLNEEQVANDVPYEMRNVYPGKYTVGIEKDGYLPWKKQFTVREKETTYVNDLNLVRADDTLSPLSTQIDAKSSVVASPDKTAAVIITEKGNAVYELSLLSLVDDTSTTIMRSASDMQPKVKWSQNGNGFLVRTRTATAESIKRYTITNDKLAAQTSIYPRNAVSQVFWYGSDVYVASSAGNAIISEQKKTPVFTSSTFWIPNGNEIYQKKGNRLVSGNNSIAISGSVGSIELVTNNFALVRSYDGFSLISFAQKSVKNIPTSEIVYDQERDRWITWSQYEMWEISTQGDATFMNRFGTPILDIEPLDTFGMVAISFPSEVVAYYPKFNLQIPMNAGQSTLISADQRESLLYLQMPNTTEIRIYEY